MNQKTKDQLINYFDEIVKTEFSQDWSLYQLEKKHGEIDRIIDQRERSIGKPKMSEFGIDADNLPDYIAVIISSVTLIVEFIRLYREGRKMKQKEMKEQLHSTQINLNVSEDVILKIMNSFYPKLEDIISESIEELDTHEETNSENS